MWGKLEKTLGFQFHIYNFNELQFCKLRIVYLLIRIIVNLNKTCMKVQFLLHSHIIKLIMIIGRKMLFLALYSISSSFFSPTKPQKPYIQLPNSNSLQSFPFIYTAQRERESGLRAKNGKHEPRAWARNERQETETRRDTHTHTHTQRQRALHSRKERSLALIRYVREPASKTSVHDSLSASRAARRGVIRSRFFLLSLSSALRTGVSRKLAQQLAARNNELESGERMTEIYGEAFRAP